MGGEDAGEVPSSSAVSSGRGRKILKDKLWQKACNRLRAIVKLHSS